MIFQKVDLGNFEALYFYSSYLIPFVGRAPFRLGFKIKVILQLQFHYFHRQLNTLKRVCAWLERMIFKGRFAAHRAAALDLTETCRTILVRLSAQRKVVY